jgi:tRNA(adenine34) deaminase
MAIDDQDYHFMQQALRLADRAEAAGEVPVGALLVRRGRVIGEGWNCPISSHDPTAHAEIMALRAAGRREANYRLPNSTLYVTLEPCPMCAGAIVHARVKRVVYAAPDPRSGAAGSVFDLLPSDQRFNHRVTVEGGCLEELAADKIRTFFRARREAGKLDDTAS